jgi:hypothetical protein
MDSILSQRTLSSFFLCVLSALCAMLFCVGCACPHRKAATSHAIEEFSGRADGLVYRETWKDSEGGGGVFFCADPNVQNMFAAHTNQSNLGGGSVFSAGTVTITVDTNTAALVGSAGTAIGNIIGAAAKTAVK